MIAPRLLAASALEARGDVRQEGNQHYCCFATAYSPELTNQA
jgi:hypothetical protein